MNSEGIVIKTVAPIYLKPSKESEMADEAIYGMVVELTESSDDFYFVKTKYDYSGYMHKDDLMFGLEDVVKWSKESTYEICHNLVDVMSLPSYKGYQLKLLPRGASLIKLGEEKDGWVSVSLACNTKGWVRKDFLRKKVNKDDLDEETLRKNLVNTAYKYLNTQYRWGGRSPLGIDCSGLCSISYLLNGVVIYRDARLKDEYMKSITMEEAKEGDLLFFPGHVAMYLGKGRFIHSSASINGVNLNSLNPEDSDFRKDLKDELYAIGTIF